MVKLLKQWKYTVLTVGRDLKWPSLRSEFTQDDALQLPELSHTSDAWQNEGDE